jgi:hypothetical protein
VIRLPHLAQAAADVASWPVGAAPVHAAALATLPAATLWQPPAVFEQGPARKGVGKLKEAGSQLQVRVLVVRGTASCMLIQTGKQAKTQNGRSLATASAHSHHSWKRMAKIEFNLNP